MLVNSLFGSPKWSSAQVGSKNILFSTISMFLRYLCYTKDNGWELIGIDRVRTPLQFILTILPEVGSCYSITS